MPDRSMVHGAPGEDADESPSARHRPQPIHQSMGRWTQYDEDEYRLPEGMKRIGYDADTGRYQFQDRDGSVWQGAEGAEFSEMTRVSDSRARGSASQDHEDDVDVEAAPTRPDGYQALSVDPDRASYLNNDSNSSPYTSLFPFFLIIAVVLLLIWRLLISPILAAPPSACAKQTMAYWVQPGDSCWDIAKTHGCTLEELKVLNSQLDCAALMPGTTVCLPNTTPT
ncbi:hypothetical protein D9615_000991 [Tricholomella constricta]|uniref:LysM domain-containing protein n=1 Tax=Tricholomella constricta TaxID=117010 RepID=A0A8H5M8Y0_9AGAR|nr:hypothetical protein D9615_000991 [Tricholomella constricta]